MTYLANKILKCICDFFNHRKRRLNKFIKACGDSKHVVEFWSKFDDDDILRHFYWTIDDCNIKPQTVKIHILHAPVYWKEENQWCIGRRDDNAENAICYDCIRKTICVYNKNGICTYTALSIDVFLKQLHSILQ